MELEGYGVDLQWHGTIFDNPLQGTLTFADGRKLKIRREYRENVREGVYYVLNDYAYPSLGELLGRGLGLSGYPDSLDLTEPAHATEIKKALEVIGLLNELIKSGVTHANVVQADFLINTWFDASIGEERRRTVDPLEGPYEEQNQMLPPGKYSVFVLLEDETWQQPTYRIDQPMTEHAFRMKAEADCGGFVSYSVCEDSDCPEEYVRTF